MSFDLRLEVAQRLERRVIGELRARGWTAEPFGQSLLTFDIREQMRQVSPATPVRWMPDIIATKPQRTRMALAFIDAKAGETYQRTGNYDIEAAALDSAERFATFARGCHYFFVFDDLGVIRPQVVRGHGSLGPYRGRGSGTPFVVINTDHAVPFDSVFGRPLPKEISP